jgi:hypothetical protein
MTLFKIKLLLWDWTYDWIDIEAENKEEAQILLNMKESKNFYKLID